MKAKLSIDPGIYFSFTRYNQCHHSCNQHCSCNMSVLAKRNGVLRCKLLMHQVNHKLLMKMKLRKQIQVCTRLAYEDRSSSTLTRPNTVLVISVAIHAIRVVINKMHSSTPHHLEATQKVSRNLKLAKAFFIGYFFYK